MDAKTARLFALEECNLDTLEALDADYDHFDGLVGDALEAGLRDADNHGADDTEGR